jgi:HlyD family secretion protein
MKRSKTRRVLLGIVFLLALVILGYMLYLIGMGVYHMIYGTPISVQVDSVLKKELVQKVSAPGKVQPVEEVSISAYVSAEITKLFVAEGDEVKKGDILVELDSTRYRATLDQAKASLYSAKAQKRLAKARHQQTERLLVRTKELYEKELVGKQELEDAETALQINLASLEAASDGIGQAQAMLRLASDDVSKATLSAPITGKISRLEKEVGEIVMGSQLTRDIIMTVANLAEMEVVVEVDENDVVDISLKDEAEIEVDALPDDIFKGHVTKISISPKISRLGSQEETTNFEVTVLLDTEVGKLRPGMNATANIVVEKQADALSLPIQCVTMRDVEMLRAVEAEEDVSTLRGRGKDALKEVVFLYEGETVTFVEVKTGISSDTEIEMVEGVEEGQQVVCGPYKILHKELTNNQWVEVATAEESAEKKK